MLFILCADNWTGRVSCCESPNTVYAENVFQSGEPTLTAKKSQFFKQANMNQHSLKSAEENPWVQILAYLTHVAMFKNMPWSLPAPSIQFQLNSLFSLPYINPVSFQPLPCSNPFSHHSSSWFPSLVLQYQPNSFISLPDCLICIRPSFPAFVLPAQLPSWSKDWSFSI